LCVFLNDAAVPAV